MATFVLIHGAWHGGWCWERVQPLLETRGHKVIAPDLPGLGSDQTPVDTVTMETWVSFVTDLIKEQNGPVVLVGHSRGGIVISEAAERIPAKIGKLVYLTAFMLPDGMSMQEVIDQSAQGETAAELIEPSPDFVTISIKSDVVQEKFYNRTAEQWVRKAEEQLRPEPVMSFLSPVAVSEDRFGRVPRAYIECTEDHVIPIELQRSFRDAINCEDVVTLDSDHSPFFSMPEELASALEDLAA